MATTEDLGNPTCPAQSEPLTIVANLFAAPPGLDRMGAVKTSTRQRAFEVCEWSADQGRPLFVLWGKDGNPRNTEHYGGYGVDFMTFANAQLSRHDRAIGDGIVDYLLKNRERLKVRGVIFRQRRIGYSSGWDNWVEMADRGSSTANHYDHVHALFEEGDYVPPPAPKPTGPTYTVKAGDTLTKIAWEYGLKSWRELAALNPGISPDAIHVGQVINVPEKPAPKPEPKPEKPKNVTNGRLVVWNVGDNSNLDKRVPKIIDGLTKLRGSILALQEYGSNEYPQIYRETGEALGDYDHYLAGNRHVGWQSDKWKVLNRRKVTLKPDRQVAAVQLESRATGARLWVFSVHLTHKAENAALRVKQTKSLITFLSSLKKVANVPILGGGDINSGGDEKDQGDVRELMRKAGYRTLVDLTGEAPATHRGTRRLDEVFFSPGVELRDVTYRYDPAASDHAAILVQFSVPNQA